MSTVDRRYPQLVHADRLPLSYRRGVGVICRRTGCSALYNYVDQFIHFYFGDVFCGVWQHSVGDSGEMSDGTVDYITLEINKCLNTPARMKDKRIEWAKASEKRSKHDRQRSEFANGARELERELKRNRNRSGMGSKFRPNAVVDGLKGSTV